MDIKEFIDEWNNGSDRMLVHTSGSTGKPKPMWVEKKRMAHSARTTCAFLGLKRGDTALLCMSLDYIAGKMMAVRAIEWGLNLVCVEPSGHPLSTFNVELSSQELKGVKGSQKPLASGANNLSSESPSLREGLGGGSTSTCQLVNSSTESNNSSTRQLVNSSTEISFAAMTPMQVYNTLQVAEERERLMQIKHLIIGGGAIDEALEAELRHFPNAVWSTYGMTETLSHIALRRISGQNNSQWYEPFDDVRVALTDEGCLVIDAPGVCAQRLVTNDCAELQPDGRRFRIIGRKDNVINSGGIKIHAEEVEQMLRPHLSMPFIITKAPDPKFGEVVALVYEDSSCGESGESVKSICQSVLPKYWQPRRYLPVERILITETGKPRRDISLYI